MWLLNMYNMAHEKETKRIISFNVNLNLKLGGVQEISYKKFESWIYFLFKEYHYLHIM